MNIPSNFEISCKCCSLDKSMEFSIVILMLVLITSVHRGHFQEHTSGLFCRCPDEHTEYLHDRLQ